MKRLFDLAVSIVCLILFLPIMPLVAVLIILKLGTPIMFTQERPGLNGKPFVLYKFRTMTDGRDGDGGVIARSFTINFVWKMA